MLPVRLIFVFGISFLIILLDDVHCKKVCRRDEFQCRDGTCISDRSFCDGRIDCLDHSDEENCKDTSCETPEWFLCADNRTCLSHKFVCDTFENCPIGDDERGCDTVVEKFPGDHCTKYEFTCSDHSCIPLGMDCDGKNDCPDNSDEIEGCKQLEGKCSGFLCKNKKCLTHGAWVCDGQDDCGDASDEDGCLSHCKLENDKFFCKDDLTCIPLSKVCDNETDCKDGSDEHKLCNVNCTSLQCPGKCHKLPTGPVCICQDGFVYNEKTKSCDDINECTIYGICSQGCINTKGSYKCTCEKDYMLKSDNKTCVVKEGDPIMLYTTQKTVVGVNLKNKHFYQIASFMSQVIGVFYDGDYVYWTDINQQEESIERAKIDGTKREVLFTVGLEAPEDIAIDWYTGNIYFTDNSNKHLAVCSNNGRNCLVLVQYNMDQPRGIALDPDHGKMYWSDWGKDAYIGRGSMDGSSVDKFIKTDIHWPNGLSLDAPNGRLYWVDAKSGKISNIKLDGTDRRVVLATLPKHPYEIAIFEDKLYWSDWGTSSIHFCNKFSGKDHEVMIKDRKIYDIHIYHPALMTKRNHSCSHHQCSHVCLLNDEQSFTCACPDGMTLEVDLRTCRNIGKKHKLFLGIGNYLVVLEHTKFGRHTVGDALPLDIFIHKMAYNSMNGTVFVADNHNRAIYEVDIENRKHRKIVSGGIENITALAFDGLTQSLFWTDSSLQSIEVFSIRNQHRAIVNRFIGNVVPVAMVVIPETGKLFVALRSGLKTQIDIISTNGRGPHHHFADEMIGGGEIQFTVDHLSETVFWVDFDEDKIEFTDYEGSMRHVFRSWLHGPVSMTLLDEDIIWTSYGTRDIYWTHRSNLASVKKFSIEKLPFMNVPDIIPIVATVPHYYKDHPCLHNNGGCSHVCVAASKTKYSCLCPAGLVFKDHKNMTCIEVLDCEFRCKSGECITMSRRCNGIKDCRDGSDEARCGKDRAIVCKLSEFACHNGEQCISKDHRCDHHVDCNDKSDEDHCEHFDHETKCHKLQFACENGRCIDPLSFCDGVDDCGDGSDEGEICKSEDHWGEVCGPDMFRCSSGQCIPKHWECDGHLDCKSGSDEHDKCPQKPCPENTFRCKQGACIDRSLKCDGHNDCGDFSDEIDCGDDKKSTPVCGNGTDHLGGDPTKFQCTSDPTICLDISAKCNGTAECPRGDDEADCHGCRHDEFECVRSKLCIRKEFRCDHERDCDDGSDELHCEHYNGTETIHFTMACHEGMFDCRDGTCIDRLRVCDGVRDCSEGEDELSACKTSCNNHSCDQKCTPSPYGAVCGCHPGFTLSGNKKMCIDINECTESNACAQLCENTYGSYRCNCYPNFILWSDKVRCKSVERGHYLLFSTFNQLRKLSEYPSTLEILYRSNDSIFTGLDVNVRRNLLYFSLKDTGSLYEYNLGNGSIRYISDVGNPRKIAVDWITNNIYYIDDSTKHSINVCFFSEKSACARLVKFKGNDVVKAIAVDAINKFLFYSVMDFKASGSNTIIFRTALDGTRSKTLINKPMDVSAMEPDPYKKLLYFTDLHSKTIRSINYNGEDMEALVKHERAIVYPSGLSIYENTAFIINLGSPEGLWCPLYGHKPCKALALNVYNAEDVVVVAPSRQKDAPNACESNKCSLICVQAETGPTCLCEDGQHIQPGKKCSTAKSGLGHRYANSLSAESTPAQSQTAESSKTTLIVCVTIMSIVALGLGMYVFYRRRTGRGNFKVNLNFHNPLVRQHNSGTEQSGVKSGVPTMSFSKGRNDMAMDTRKDTYKSARSMRCSEDSDCESMRDLDNFDDDPRARLVL